MKRETFTQIRHGETTQNANKNRFYGGGPDDTEHGDVKLTSFGERQLTELAPMMAASHIAMTRTVASGLHRARHSRDLAVARYPLPPTDNRVDPALNEISHGILERQMVGQRHAEQAEELTLRVMARLLSECGLEERLVVAFAGWLVPLGHGDGESHLVAGLRVCSAIDAVEARGELDGTAFFGHHGSGRNGRALGTTFSRESRGWLKSAVDGLLQPDYLAARTAILDIQQDYPKNIIGRKALEKILTPLAAAAAPFVPVLAQAGLPTAAELRNPEYKALNGSASIVEVRDDGLWERGWRLSPEIREGKEKFTMPINFSFGPYTEQPPFK